ncbi:MAG: tyrosine--tRNA ligase [Tissierellia bacterium]|nr:tyrosine--tRNA ligase [Tissierellia bacterium]
MNIYDELLERGYISQCTHEQELRELFQKEKVTFYIGIDATADSLHAGHFLTLVVMKRMQEAGHRPILLLGGGTTLIGDPTGRDDMRKILTREDIENNAMKIKDQVSRFIDFDEGKALMLNNADWLVDLKYIDFLRDYGPYFSINRMIKMDSYQTRLEQGLTYFEFSYMPLQAYDFLHLYRTTGCRLQMGGSDQWSNIIGGIDLIKRIENADCYGLTFNLITTSAGVKMGKTQKGALWLDSEKTSPYEFFQYWRNVEDASVETLLMRYTFLSLEKIKELMLPENNINIAKEILAYELTQLVHGKEEAEGAIEASKALFSGAGNLDDVPSSILKEEFFGQEWLDILLELGFIKSKGEGRRLIDQKGLRLNEELLDDSKRLCEKGDFEKGFALLRRGKKVYFKIDLN